MYTAAFLNADGKVYLITISDIIFINFTIFFYSELTGICVKPDIRIITYPYTIMRSMP